MSSSFSSLLLCCSFRLSFDILLLLPLLFLFYQGVLGAGKEFCINTAEGLIQFSKNVSSGTNYKGTSVFLDADIDFYGDLSEQFEPIRTTTSKGHLMGRATQSATLQ